MQVTFLKSKILGPSITASMFNIADREWFGTLQWRKTLKIACAFLSIHSRISFELRIDSELNGTQRNRIKLISDIHKDSLPNKACKYTLTPRLLDFRCLA